MKIGIAVPNYCGGVRGPEVPTLAEIVRFAKSAESLGMNGLWVVDHLLVAWPIYSTTWLDITAQLGVLAAETKTIPIGPSILVAGTKSPALVAKEMASIDVLSNGRLIFGIGNGWYDKEFEAVNIPKKERGRRTTEMIEIVKKLWTEEKVSFNGQFYKFSEIDVYPKPKQKPHPPIWIAGGSAIGQAEKVYQVRTESILRRIAKYGDGWFSRAYNDMSALEDDWKLVQNYMKEYNRSRADITFAAMRWMLFSEGKSDATVRELFSRCLSIPMEDVKKEAIYGTKSQMLKKIEELAQLGVQYITILPTGFDYELMEFITKEVLPSFSR